MNFLRTLRVHRYPSNPQRGLLIADGRVILCSLGRSGPSVFKIEGDGATPAHHVMKPVKGFYRHDRVKRPRSPIEFEPIAKSDGWCDAPQHPCYNLPVNLPFSTSHEVMMRDDQLYNLGLILDWNMPSAGRARYRGSAIFMHLCKAGYQPTEGCIAIKEGDMRWLLQHISVNTRIIVSR